MPKLCFSWFVVVTESAARPNADNQIAIVTFVTKSNLDNQITTPGLLYCIACRGQIRFRGLEIKLNPEVQSHACPLGLPQHRARQLGISLNCNSIEAKQLTLPSVSVRV
jgi:hypothetical protein